MMGSPTNQIEVLLKVPGERPRIYTFPPEGETRTKELEAAARATIQLHGWMANPTQIMRVDDWNFHIVLPEGATRLENPFASIVQPRPKARRKDDKPSGAD